MADQLTKMQKTLVVFETAAATAVGATIIFGQNLSDKVTAFLMPEFMQDPILNARRAVSAADELTTTQAQQLGEYVGYGTVIIIGAAIGGAVCLLGLNNKKAVQHKFQVNDEDVFMGTGSITDAALPHVYSQKKNNGPTY